MKYSIEYYKAVQDVLCSEDDVGSDPFATEILDALAKVGALLPPPAVMKAPETEGDRDTVGKAYDAASEARAEGALYSMQVTILHDALIAAGYSRSLPPAEQRAPDERVELRAALRNMADAYVRRIKTNLTADEIAKEPWRCAEYIEAERLCKKPFKLRFTEEWLRAKIESDPDDLPCEAGVATDMPAVPTDAEIEEIEKRHEADKASVMNYTDDFERTMARAHACFIDRATLLRRLKAPAVTMPGRLDVQKIIFNGVLDNGEKLGAILALWNGRV